MVLLLKGEHLLEEVDQVVNLQVEEDLVVNQLVEGGLVANLLEEVLLPDEVVQLLLVNLQVEEDQVVSQLEAHQLVEEDQLLLEEVDHKDNLQEEEVQLDNLLVEVHLLVSLQEVHQLEEEVQLLLVGELLLVNLPGVELLPDNLQEEEDLLLEGLHRVNLLVEVVLPLLVGVGLLVEVDQHPKDKEGVVLPLGVGQLQEVDLLLEERLLEEEEDLHKEIQW